MSRLEVLRDAVNDLSSCIYATRARAIEARQALKGAQMTLEETTDQLEEAVSILLEAFEALEDCYE